MADLITRRLERRYRQDPTDENLARLNSHLIRQGLLDLPESYNEITEIERNMGRGGLPILLAALAENYRECRGPTPSVYDAIRDEDDAENRRCRGLVDILVHAIGRWGSVDDIPFLEQVRDYINEHNLIIGLQGTMVPGRPHYTAQTISAVIEWLTIRHQYGFTDETTVWDVINASPLIDEVIVASNAHAVSSIYYQRRFGSWQQDPEIPYYGGIYRESGYSPSWRSSVPGYGDASPTAEAAANDVLHSILAAKYMGRIKGNRDPLPQDKWPTHVVFCCTGGAVAHLSEQRLHEYRVSDEHVFFSDPYRYCYLFNYPPLHRYLP